jgi:hypothetical protein
VAKAHFVRIADLQQSSDNASAAKVRFEGTRDSIELSARKAALGRSLRLARTAESQPSLRQAPRSAVRTKPPSDVPTQGLILAQRCDCHREFDIPYYAIFTNRIL